MRLLMLRAAGMQYQLQRANRAGLRSSHDRKYRNHFQPKFIDGNIFQPAFLQYLLSNIKSTVYNNSLP